MFATGESIALAAVMNDTVFADCQAAVLRRHVDWDESSRWLACLGLFRTLTRVQAGT